MRTTRWGQERAGGEGDPNILKLGDTTRIHLIDPEKADWRQHTLESLHDDEQVQFLVCPGARRCPMCRKPVGIQEVKNQDGHTVREEVQLFPTSVRFACNVWDYETSSVKVLIAGPMIFREFDDAAKVGYDPTDSDWTIHRTGKGKSTKYTVIRGDTGTMPEIAPEDLHDLSKYGDPKSEEAIFEALEKAGYDYDAIEVPTYTVEEAEEYVVPYGKKHKGDTLEVCLATDPEWCEFMYNVKLEDGALGDPLFLNLHTLMLDRGLVEPLDEVQAATPPTPEKKPVEETSKAMPITPVKTPPQTGAVTVTLIGPDGAEGSYPLEAVEALKAAGFTEPEEEKPEPEGLVADQEYMVRINGALLRLKGEVVEQMQAAGQDVKLEEPDDAADAVREEAAQGKVETPQPDDSLHGKAKTELQAIAKDKGLKISGTKPELIARIEGAVSEGQTPATDAQSVPTGNGHDADTLERVKAAIAAAPIKDYDALLALFDDIAGEHDLAKFSEEQLLKLEERLATGDPVG